MKTKTLLILLSLVLLIACLSSCVTSQPTLTEKERAIHENDESVVYQNLSPEEKVFYNNTITTMTQKEYNQRLQAGDLPRNKRVVVLR